MQNEFPTVEELSNGFSEFKLEEAKELKDTTIELFYEDSKKVNYHFLDKNCIRVEYENNIIYSSIYSAVSPSENMYIIDFMKGYGAPSSITIVVDYNKGIATTLVGKLPTKEEADVSQLVRAKEKMPMTSVKVEFLHG